MCLIAWDWRPGSDTPLRLLANRDEFYGRPALPLHWWDGGRILAGKDLQAGGTWLGVSRSGRLAALTNFRDPSANRPDAPSRGMLVTGFLESALSAHQFLDHWAPASPTFNAFNLLLFDGECLLGWESRHSRIISMEVGMGAVSNADFFTPWPKLVSLQTAFQERLQSRQLQPEQLLPLLLDRQIAQDAELPRTGIPMPLERTLSPVFIASPGYGTRASTVVTRTQDAVDVTEQSFDQHGTTDFRHESFALRP